MYVFVVGFFNHMGMCFLQLTDRENPLATSTPLKKSPVNLNKKITSRGKNSGFGKQSKLFDMLVKSGPSEGSRSTQTARLIYDGNRAEYISKNNARKVLSMGNTKVFTKGVKCGKTVSSDEIITVD